ncbi:hypothetical protein [uncultured Nostoc sp.]|uniref:hypothetical protein n=1 Tax=uncultured Nostoc sp. TaxID=340711 RepID=UPI00261EFA1C|nr:hypothetical protein [uncultured Nostoc sp.]
MTIFALVYIDEDVDILVATLLLARGFDATTAREQQILGEPIQANCYNPARVPGIGIIVDSTVHLG